MSGIGAAPSRDFKRLDQKVPAAAATLDFTSFIDATYRRYVLSGWVRPATDNTGLFLRTDANGGASFDAGANDYDWGGRWFGIGVAGADVNGAAVAQIELTPPNGAGSYPGNAADERVHFEVTLSSPSDAAYLQAIAYRSWWRDSGGVLRGFVGVGHRRAAGIVNALRLLWSGGNFAAVGLVTLEGFR